MNLTQDIRQEKCSIELEQIEQRAYVLARLNKKKSPKQCLKVFGYWLVVNIMQ